MRAAGWSLLLLARVAAAHIVPIPPSQCVLDPAEIVAPESGVVATVDPPAGGQVVIRYDTQASQAQFDLTAVAPRSFVAAGVAGTFALPTIFPATLTHSGDLTTVAPLPVLVTMNGITLAVPLTLTTSLAAAGSTMVQGAPIGGDGRFTLVGLSAASGLGAPFGPGMLSVRFGCQAAPRPDTDQFVGQTTALSAGLAAQTFRLRAIFAPGGSALPDLAGTPAILRATSGGAVLATAYLPGGLAAHGRKVFIGRSADGRAALGVRMLHRSGQVSFLMAVRIAGATPPQATSASVPAEVVYEAGGFASRVSLAFRANRRGTRFRFP